MFLTVWGATCRKCLHYNRAGVKRTGAIAGHFAFCIHCTTKQRSGKVLISGAVVYWCRFIESSQQGLVAFPLGIGPQSMHLKPITRQLIAENFRTENKLANNLLFCIDLSTLLLGISWFWFNYRSIYVSYDDDSWPLDICWNQTQRPCLLGVDA